jgi:hypothetical protein
MVYRVATMVYCVATMLSGSTAVLHVRKFGRSKMPFEKILHILDAVNAVRLNPNTCNNQDATCSTQAATCSTQAAAYPAAGPFQLAHPSTLNRMHHRWTPSWVLAEVLTYHGTIRHYGVR